MVFDPMDEMTNGRTSLVTGLVQGARAGFERAAASDLGNLARQMGRTLRLGAPVGSHPAETRAEYLSVKLGAELEALADMCAQERQTLSARQTPSPAMLQMALVGLMSIEGCLEALLFDYIEQVHQTNPRLPVVLVEREALAGAQVGMASEQPRRLNGRQCRRLADTLCRTFTETLSDLEHIQATLGSVRDSELFALSVALNRLQALAAQLRRQQATLHGQIYNAGR